MIENSGAQMAAPTFALRVGTMASGVELLDDGRFAASLFPIEDT